MDILLANPRGFCAGVERAIAIVERALEKFGAPIYVRHEVVHNRYVVDGLKAKGAVFVEELAEVPVVSASKVPIEYMHDGLPGDAGTHRSTSVMYRSRVRRVPPPSSSRVTKTSLWPSWASSKAIHEASPCRAAAAKWRASRDYVTPGGWGKGR